MPAWVLCMSAVQKLNFGLSGAGRHRAWRQFDPASVHVNANKKNKVARDPATLARVAEVGPGHTPPTANSSASPGTPNQHASCKTLMLTC